MMDSKLDKFLEEHGYRNYKRVQTMIQNQDLEYPINHPNNINKMRIHIVRCIATIEKLTVHAIHAGGTLRLVNSIGMDLIPFIPQRYKDITLETRKELKLIDGCIDFSKFDPCEFEDLLKLLFDGYDLSGPFIHTFYIVVLENQGKYAFKYIP